MIRFVVVLIFLACVLKSYSQIEFQVRELSISNVTLNKEGANIIDEDELDGPYLHFVCIIENKSDKKVVLHPSISELYLNFDYNESTYTTECFALQFQDNDSLIIDTKRIIYFSFGENVFLCTPIWDENKNDYSKELREILPTIILEYREGNLKLVANKIVNTKIID